MWSRINVISAHQNFIKNNSLFEKEFSNVLPMEKAREVKKMSFCSSHRALKPVLVLGQLFGVMPLYGITEPRANQLKFKWFHCRMIHCCIILTALIIMSILSAHWAIVLQTIKVLDPFIWYTSKIIFVVFLMILAKRWPLLMVHWEDIEAQLPVYKDEHSVQRFQKVPKIIKIFSIGLTLTIFVEHSMAITAGVYRIAACENRTIIEKYFRQAFPEVYLVTDYSAGIKEFFLELINYYCAFIWSFIDMLIISISICLTARFQQFSDHLSRYKAMAMPNSFWMDQRQIYINLCNLVSTVDDVISSVIVISTLNNFYYILIQLLFIFHPKRFIIEAVYYWFSLFFLFARILLVSLNASNINEEAKRPVDIIRAIPDVSYSEGARRLLELVTKQEIALTGMKFFYLSKSLILSVAGTIITYELVLVQFQSGLIEHNHCAII